MTALAVRILAKVGPQLSTIANLPIIAPDPQSKSQAGRRLACHRILRLPVTATGPYSTENPHSRDPEIITLKGILLVRYPKS